MAISITVAKRITRSGDIPFHLLLPVRALVGHPAVGVEEEAVHQGRLEGEGEEVEAEVACFARRMRSALW